MKIIFDAQSLEINPSGDGYVAMMDGKKMRIEIVRVDFGQGRMDLRFTDMSDSALIRESVFKSVHVSSDGAKRWVTIDGQTIMLTKTSGAKRGVRHDHAGGLIAPMPGQVRSVSVSAGDAVKKGQTLLTMEAMKMEIRIQALKDGVVKMVYAAQGQTVEREQILIEMED
ncbi:MAG: acetyl-CoA carboxylase biotin carboxyl carrier protein subunit [Anaerolineales bacterium]|uniref:acetyl-CoA carboxylase biotin carboxyl carrier protein subunit n=1 Tax=Candidatus Villigracilis proximus TaxID=3140683 RepID=UPI003136E0A5|nr:acetyl-CoA carboxylase biotin carboxyl carrier protein subunit [Anaerolineales bacterium]